LVNSDFDLNIIDDSLKFYVAPEIINPDLRFQLKGDKIDVFALGVMLFVTLFGRAPFKAATQTDLLYKYFFDTDQKHTDKFFKVHPATRGKHLSDDLKLMLLDMLHPNPQKRPTVRELLQNYSWFNTPAAEMITKDNAHYQ
jgi:serine/threonine protein kinase